MTDTHAPKLLIVATNVSSKFGGEAFLPLKYFQLLRARGYPVKLITHAHLLMGLTGNGGNMASVAADQP